MIKIILSLTVCIFSTPIVAQAQPKVTIHGIYMGSTSKIVKIKNRGKKIVKVPRRSVKVPLRGLIEGIATVQAKVSIADMIKYNGNPMKKASK